MPVNSAVGWTIPGLNDNNMFAKPASGPGIVQGDQVPVPQQAGVSQPKSGLNWQSILGAGLGLYGATQTGKTQTNAANTAAAGAAFNPYNTTNVFGGTQFSGNNINQTTAPWLQQILAQLQASANGGFNTGFRAGGTNQMGAGLGGYGGAVDAANNYAMPDPAQYATTLAQQQAIAGGMQNLFTTSQNNPYALEQMGFGRNLLGNNYDSVAASRLNLLRQNAAPQEDAATNALFQRLAGQGRLGSADGTGINSDIRSFSKGLSDADTGRQLSAQDLAMQLYSQDQSTGANMFNSGVGNYQQGIRDTASIGGMAQTAAGVPLDTAANYNNLGYNRANDAIKRASDQFGFGETAAGADNRNASDTLGIMNGVQAAQNANTTLGINAGQAGASAGANQGKFTVEGANNPLGAAATGLGSSLLQNATGGLGILPAAAGAVKAGVAAYGAGGGVGGGLAAAGHSILGSMGLGGGTTAAAGTAAAGTEAAAATASSTAAAAGGGMGGIMSGVMAAAPYVAAAIAAAAVISNNVAKSSPLNGFDENSLSWTKDQNFDKTKFSAQELNTYFGPAVQKFAQTGDAAAALASIPPPQNAREQTMLKGGAKALFGGTGNPFRKIAQAKGFGEGIWTAGNDDKKEMTKFLSAGNVPAGQVGAGTNILGSKV